MSDLRPYISSGYEASTWWEHQIYDGENTIVMGVSNFVVPAVGDFIINQSGSTIIRYLVTNVSNNIAERIRVYEDVIDDSIEDLSVQDLHATAMVLMRSQTTPVIAAVHIGLPIETDSFVSYAKLFTGKDISELDAVVSRRLDNDNEVIDDRITVVQDSINAMRFHCNQFHLDRILEDKSYGKLVMYGSDDMPICSYTIIFRETESLINFSNSDLFITDLVLESSMVNPSNSKEILVEKGFLNSSFNPRVYKIFNDGKQREEISLTSRSLSLEGWGNYIYGEENDTFPLSVQYTLASNEKSDMVSDENSERITAHYTIRVIDDANSTNYKLYPVIQWNALDEEYTIRFYMYDSTYKTNVDVTDFIVLSDPFEGANYVEKQYFNFNVDLKTAGISIEEEYSTGSFAIELVAPPMDATTPYRIFMVPTDEERYYGEALRTRCKYELGNNIIEIDSDYTSYDEWIENVYYKLLPTYDSNTNSQAPHPTHVGVTIDGVTVSLDVLTQWNVGVKWPYSTPKGQHTAQLHWYSLDTFGKVNYLAISSMQLEIV